MGLPVLFYLHSGQTEGQSEESEGIEENQESFKKCIAVTKKKKVKQKKTSILSQFISSIPLTFNYQVVHILWGVI